MPSLSQAPLAPCELVRVAPDDDRYILVFDDGIVTAGSRDAVTNAFSRLKAIASPAVIDQLFAIADRDGGTKPTSTWGIGRYIYHEDVYGESGLILGVSFADVATGIASGTAADVIVDNMALGGGVVPTYNLTMYGFIYASARRLGISTEATFELDYFIVQEVGTLSRDFRIALLDIGAEVVHGLGIAYESVSDRNRDIVRWAAASSFLLADYRTEESFSSFEEAVAAAMPVVSRYTTLDPVEVAKVLVSTVHVRHPLDEVRDLLDRCVAGADLPLPTIGTLLFEGCSVASVHQVLDAGIDSDLADALVAR